MKVLFAEDDLRLGELTTHILRKTGAIVDWVTTGRDAFDYAQASAYDVVILDWMMPDGDGRTTCLKLRRSGYQGAILMLTAKDAVTDRVQGLDAGADDYVVKPYAAEELLARLRTMQRRNFAPLQDEIVHYRQWQLQRTNQAVVLGEMAVQLTPREFGVLDLLMQNKGRTLTREIILDRIWGLEADVHLKSIDAIVKLIRKKLKEIEAQDIILSVRGVGYKINE